MDEVQVETSQQLPRRATERAGGRFVDISQSSTCVGTKEQSVGALHDGTVTVFRFSQRLFGALALRDVFHGAFEVKQGAVRALHRMSVSGDPEVTAVLSAHFRFEPLHG